MPFSITMKVILPGKKFANKKWFDEMAREQRRSVTASGSLRKLFEKTVFGWSRKPSFGWAQRRTADEMSITMYPTGQYAEIWKLVSAGSKPHYIPATGTTLMSFRTGYRSATRPGTLMSRRAYRSGKQVAAYRISKNKKHPGFDPRNFPEMIAEEYRGSFTDAMQDAINIIAKNG